MMKRFIVLLLAGLFLSGLALSANAQAPKPFPYPLKGSLSRLQVFPGPTAYPFTPTYCGYVAWFWGSRVDGTANRVPDPTLPRDCVSQTSYVTCCRFQVTLDGTKLPVWFQTNHPDWVQYGPPQALQGTMSASGSSIDDITFNTSFAIDKYSLNSTFSFPRETVISSIASDGTTITLSNVSACTASSSCGTRDILMFIDGWAPLNLTGTVTDGSAVITNVKLDYNGAQASNGIAGVQGSFAYGNSCLTGGSSVSLMGTSFPQTYFLDTPIKSDCAGGTQRFTLITSRNESSQRPWGNCNGNCRYEPLNIEDPAVQEFLLSGCRRDDGSDCSIMSLVNAGFAGIALDNSHMFNGASNDYGHFLGGVGPCAKINQPACGGTLVQDHNIENGWGGATYGDAKFQNGRIEWARRIRAAVNAAGAVLIPNGGGFPSGSAAARNTDIAATAMLANTAGAIAFEHAGSGGCDDSGQPVFLSMNYWLNMFKVMSMTTVPVGIVEDTYCGTTVTQPGGAEEQFDVATYLMIANANCADGVPGQPCFWYGVFTPTDRAQTNAGILPTYHASWDVDCGAVAQAGRAGVGVVAASDTAYARVYPKCIVALNPDDTNTATVTLPAGHLYTDLYGNPVAAGVLTLNPTVPGATGNSIVAIMH